MAKRKDVTSDRWALEGRWRGELLSCQCRQGFLGEEALVRLQAVVRGAVGDKIGCGELALICSGL